MTYNQSYGKDPYPHHLFFRTAVKKSRRRR